MVVGFQTPPALGQVKIQRGNPEPTKNRFTTPVDVEIPIPAIAGERSPEVQGENIQRYVFDGISIARYAAATGKLRNGHVPLRVVMHLNNEPSVDKRVSFTATLARDGKPLSGPVVKKGVSVREQQLRRVTFEFNVAASEIGRSDIVINLSIDVRPDA